MMLSAIWSVVMMLAHLQLLSSDPRLHHSKHHHAFKHDKFQRGKDLSETGKKKEPATHQTVMTTAYATTFQTDEGTGAVAFTGKTGASSISRATEKMPKSEKVRAEKKKKKMSIDEINDDDNKRPKAERVEKDAQQYAEDAKGVKDDVTAGSAEPSTGTGVGSTIKAEDKIDDLPKSEKVKGQNKREKEFMNKIEKFKVKTPKAERVEEDEKETTGVDQDLNEGIVTGSVASTGEPGVSSVSKEPRNTDKMPKSENVKKQTKKKKDLMDKIEEAKAERVEEDGSQKTRVEKDIKDGVTNESIASTGETEVLLVSKAPEGTDSMPNSEKVKAQKEKRKELLDKIQEAKAKSLKADLVKGDTKHKTGVDQDLNEDVGTVSVRSTGEPGVSSVSKEPEKTGKMLESEKVKAQKKRRKELLDKIEDAKAKTLQADSVKEDKKHKNEDDQDMKEGVVGTIHPKLTSIVGTSPSVVTTADQKEQTKTDDSKFSSFSEMDLGWSSTSKSVSKMPKSSKSKVVSSKDLSSERVLKELSEKESPKADAVKHNHQIVKSSSEEEPRRKVINIRFDL